MIYEELFILKGGIKVLRVIFFRSLTTLKGADSLAGLAWGNFKEPFLGDTDRFPVKISLFLFGVYNIKSDSVVSLVETDRSINNFVALVHAPLDLGFEVERGI